MQKLLVKTLIVGQLQTNCYILRDPISKSALVIDPGDDADYIQQTLQDWNVAPTHLLATHGHFDHIMAAYELQQAYHIPFCIHQKDRFLVDRMHESAKYFLKYDVVEPAPKIDMTLTNTSIITIGAFKLRVIETPGHTPGSVCLYEKSQKLLFSGDTLFAGGAVGRTDFTYSSSQQLDKSLMHLLSFPQELSVLPGHGEQTTIEAERKIHQY